MPDSAWTTIAGEEAVELETDFGSEGHHVGHLDPIGGVYWKPTLPSFSPPQPAEFPPEQGAGPFHWETTRTDVFRLLFTEGVTPPAARRIRQHCNRCGGTDVDTLVDLSPTPRPVPAGPMHHVGVFERGFRDGNLYARYRVHGMELRRTIRIVKYLDLALHPEVPVGPATWQRRTIDRTEQGPYVHWLTAMRRIDCGTGLSKVVFGETLRQDLVVALHGAGVVATLLDDGGGLAEMMSTAQRCESPRFAVDVSDGGRVRVTLVDESADGDRREVGRAKLRHHEPGFVTLRRWKPAD